MAESIVLRHPLQSRSEASGDGAIIYVPGSSGVALDRNLWQLWAAAEGKTIVEVAAALSTITPALDVELNVTALKLAGLLLPPITPTSVGAHAAPLTSIPLVSVVIVTRNGKHHLEECLPSLLRQTYRALEIIVVDDQSTDDTIAWLQAKYSQVRIILQTNGPNFAAGNNRGIEQAHGELLLLLNNDTVLDPRCIEELVSTCQEYPQTGGVNALLRFYDNRPFVNGLGTFVRRREFGYDIGIGGLDVGQFQDGEPVPLLCFGAALIPRQAFERVGLLDEGYQFYYEDADWSYRARALGYELRGAPAALVYHKFSASTSSLPSTFKNRLATRNRLRFVLKNLPGRQVLAALFDYALNDALRLGSSVAHRQFKLAGSMLQAWAQFGMAVPAILTLRRKIWRGRPRVAVNLLEQAIAPPELYGPYPRLTQEMVEVRYGPHLRRMMSNNHRQRLLIISPDIVAANMGGVGMRYWELAGALSQHAQVTLAIPNAVALHATTFTVKPYTPGVAETLQPLAVAADMVLLSGFLAYHHPFLRQISQYRIVDLYDPTVLENLERFATYPMSEQLGLHQTGVETYNDLLNLGDFFICASEKQRDYWLGALSTTGRINPRTYTDDPTLRRLIDVVPFGLSDAPPHHVQQILKGVVPGIATNDKVILWGGGLWDWLDPLTAIEAMPRVLAQVPEARLFFLGTRHPNPDVPPSRMAQRAIERAAQLGLKDRAVFFNDWTPYAERANYLLEADVGISLHGDHIETRFSVRTRLMDYLWASLPMVITGGDTLSDLMAANGLGRVIGAGQVQEAAEALIELLQFPIDRERFRVVSDCFRWSKAAEPLARYVAAPWRNGERSMAESAPARPVTPLMQLPRKAWTALTERGPRGLLKEIRSYLIWRLKGR